MESVLQSVENAQKTYSISRSSSGTLSFLEWESVLRLVGINLGDHFSAHMTHRVRTLWSVNTSLVVIPGPVCCGCQVCVMSTAV